LYQQKTNMTTTTKDKGQRRVPDAVELERLEDARRRANDAAHRNAFLFAISNRQQRRRFGDRNRDRIIPSPIQIDGHAKKI
jgi:hypothetical protein